MTAQYQVDLVLMDIEGTTTPIDFVKKILFPYSKIHLPKLIQEQSQDPQVKEYLNQVAQELQTESSGSVDQKKAIQTLLQWVDEDRKHSALKKLQGMVWKKGYFDGDYTAPLYEDVIPCWKKWRKQEKSLAIYSSGSIKAQKLLFQFTNEGDVRSYLSDYFDTSSGQKKESQSYQNIAESLQIAPQKILFLSDIAEELDAAKLTGMKTIQLVRPGTSACSQHEAVSTFEEIKMDKP